MAAHSTAGHDDDDNTQPILDQQQQQQQHVRAEACSVGKRPASLACILASTQQAAPLSCSMTICISASFDSITTGNMRDRLTRLHRYSEIPVILHC